MYEIYLESSAEKDFLKLPAAPFKTILTKIKSLADNPRPPGCIKLKDTEKFWRVRIGNYRVVYEIDDSAKNIRIYKIKHRKDVYR